MEKVFSSINNAIFILDDKVPPEILKVNQEAVNMFGYNEKEMLGRTTQFLHIDKKHLIKFEKELFPIIDSGKRFVDQEFEMKRKNGEIFPSIHTVIPLFTDKKRTGWVSVVRDITERKKNEKILLENEEKYRNFLDNSIDLIQMVNSKGRFIYVNKKWCETLGYSVEEAKSMKFTEIIKKSDLAHCLNIFKKLMSGESLNNIETTYITKDKKEIDVLGSVNSIMKEGKFDSTLGIFQNITKIRKREEFKEDYLKEVEKINRLMVGRELKMIELKNKIKELESKFDKTDNKKEAHV